LKFTCNLEFTTTCLFRKAQSPQLSFLWMTRHTANYKHFDMSTRRCIYCRLL